MAQLLHFGASIYVEYGQAHVTRLEPSEGGNDMSQFTSDLKEIKALDGN
jgi:hypothetical protein